MAATSEEVKRVLSFGKTYGEMRVRPLLQRQRGPSHVIFEVDEVGVGTVSFALEVGEARQLMEWLWRVVGPTVE